MPLPNINPLAAKLMGGRDFREQLRESLLERAEATDDPAYRQRLLEVADGKRPLRTLMHDPGFAPELRQEAERLEAEPPRVELDGSPEEVLALLRDQLEAGGGQVPTLEEARALFGEALGDPGGDRRGAPGRGADGLGRFRRGSSGRGALIPLGQPALGRHDSFLDLAGGLRQM